MTLDQAEAVKSRMAEAGFALSGDSGAIQQAGCRIGWALEAGVLLLEVLSKPRFVPMMAVKATIRSVLAGEWISEAC